MRTIFRELSVTSLLVLVTTIACSKPPSKELLEAETAVNAAAQGGAEKFALTELTMARSALSAARTKNRSKDYVGAKADALYAQATALHARTTALEAKSKAEAAEAVAKALAEQFRRVWQIVYGTSPSLQGIPASAIRRQRYKNGFKYEVFADPGSLQNMDVYVLPTERDAVFLVRAIPHDLNYSALRVGYHYSEDQIVGNTSIGVASMVDLKTGLMQSWAP